MAEARIPMAMVGPLKMVSGASVYDVSVPLVTYEAPLWPSTQRGANVSQLCDGIDVVVLGDKMTRSILLQAASARAAAASLAELEQQRPTLEKLVVQTSGYAKLLDFKAQLVGNLLFIRFEIYTGDAAGHNMATKAAEKIMGWILTENKSLSYVSLSSNFCADKKATGVNGLLGRGKYVVADMLVPKSVCERHLRTTPCKMVDLNVKKNLMGSLVAGSLRSANAHFANILLAMYLATGQDAANIVEGSQGFTEAQLKGDDLYFSVTLPNVIVGTVGNGKHHDFVRNNLAAMGCLQDGPLGVNSKKLASIIAAAVLCAELSLLAALTNPTELMRCHLQIERRTRTPAHEV